MSRIYLMSLLFVCPGCGSLFQSAMQIAEFGKAANAAVAQASVDDAVAALQVELPVQDLVAGPAKTAGDRTVIVATPPAASGLESALTGGMKALGSTDDYSDLPRGCTIEIRRLPAGIAMRASCFEVVEGRQGNARSGTERKTWQDPYLVARVFEHLDAAAATRLWAAEPTGHRLRRCAIGPEMLNFGCPPKREKKAKAG